MSATTHIIGAAAVYLACALWLMTRYRLNRQARRGWIDGSPVDPCGRDDLSFGLLIAAAVAVAWPVALPLGLCGLGVWHLSGVIADRIGGGE